MIGTADAARLDMAILTDREIIEELNDLILLDHETSRTYEAALPHVDAAEVDTRTALRAFMIDHLRHVTDLAVVVRELGATPIDPSREPPVLRGVTDTLRALEVMRVSERLAAATYDQAALLDLPIEARDAVLHHLEDERRHLATLEALIERLRSRGAGMLANV